MNSGGSRGIWYFFLIVSYQVYEYPFTFQCSTGRFSFALGIQYREQLGHEQIKSTLAVADSLEPSESRA